MKKKKALYLTGDIIGILVAFVVFIIPFIFMFVNSLKERREANLLSIAWPKELQWDNFKQVLTTSNGIVLTAFKNSFI